MDDTDSFKPNHPMPIDVIEAKITIKKRWIGAGSNRLVSKMKRINPSVDTMLNRMNRFNTSLDPTDMYRISSCSSSLTVTEDSFWLEINISSNDVNTKIIGSPLIRNSLIKFLLHFLNVISLIIPKN